MPTWTEDIVGALTNLGGTGTYQQIYDEVEALRPHHPGSWKEIVRRSIQDRSSDSRGWKRQEDLFFAVEGLGQGVWGLRGSIEHSPVAADLELPDCRETPERAAQTTYRILRDTRLAREIKLLHRDACQICGETLRLSPTKTYSEAHHVIPLGRPHNGPDTPSNIIVLCPNHHALCDMGAITLRPAELVSVDGHEVAQVSLAYHNRQIFGRVF